MSTSYVRYTFRDDTDALFDPTSIVLSDPTGAYGVKRNDTDAVVVADEAAFTNIGVGIYERAGRTRRQISRIPLTRSTLSAERRTGRPKPLSGRRAAVIP